MENNQKMALTSDSMTRGVLLTVDKYREKGEIHLPPNYSVANAMKSAMLVLDTVTDKNKRPALAVCTQKSIWQALFDTVVQGLDPGKKQCYYIVYNDKLTMQRSYFGDMHLAKLKNPDIYDIYADVVYEADEFEYQKKRGRTEIVKHNQKLGNIDKNKIVAAYCTVEYKDGRENTTIMTIDEIKRAWSMSKAYPLDNEGNLKAGSTHAKFPGEMAMKTVIRKACKPLINSSDDSTLVMNSIYRTSDEAVDSRLEAEIEENSSINDVDTNDPPAPIIDVDPNTGEVVNEIPAELPIGTDPY